MRGAPRASVSCGRLGAACTCYAGREPIKPSSDEERRRAARIGAEQRQRVPAMNSACDRRRIQRENADEGRQATASEQGTVPQQGAITALIGMQDRIVRSRRRRVLVTESVPGAPGAEIRCRRERGQGLRNRRRDHKQPQGGHGQPCNETPSCIAPAQPHSQITKALSRLQG